ncbi:TRAP transporter large permease [Dysosmobacter sp.]|jgi:tripartite ATP-independent transporter DctM subunit|uniref:TRAP transporter large permease n=1 Tax=Dysosmobacter sp. TaxID=2591382 RepID=UPI003D8B7384
MSAAVLCTIVIILVCFFLKVPIFISLVTGCAYYFFVTPNAALEILAQRLTSGIESTALLAVPFFVCAGVFMNYCGITSRIMNFCSVLTGRMCGGLAQVNILLSTLMGGLSGSNIADAAMEAKMLVPEMEKAGMSKSFSTVVTAFSSVITPLIPPGICMILYGTMAGVSIGKIFIAGIAIGLLTCVMLMVLTYWISKKRGYTPIRTQAVTGREFWEAFRQAFFPLCLPVIIIGGIRIGIFTPTEAGAVAIIYSVVLGMAYGNLKGKEAFAALKESVITTGSILPIVGAAAILSWILTKEQIPQTLSAMMVSSISNKYLFLIVVNVFLLLVGMFLEGTAATIILVPLLAPIAAQFGIDEIRFAFIYIFNLSIGAISPPMGTLMYVTCGITGCKTKDFLVESVPYFLLFLLELLVITFIPGATTWILDLLY